MIGASALAFMALANTGMAAVQVDGITYELDAAKKTAMVVAGEVPSQGAVVIPDAITVENVDYVVNEIDSCAFLQNVELTSIVIGNNVEKIGFSAFERCIKLEEITFGENVYYLGYEVLKNCKSLEYVTLPNSLRVLGDESFKGCENLVYVGMSSAVEYIGNRAFKQSGLYTANIPDAAVFLGNNFLADGDVVQIIAEAEYPQNANADTFTGVDKKRCTLYVPAGSIERYAKKAYWKEFVKIEEIQPDVLYGIVIEDICYNLNTSDKTAKVVRGRFAGQWSIPATVDFEGDTYTVTTIGRYAFADCVDLLTIELPATLTSIEEGAFAGCTGIEEVYCYAEEIPVIAPDAFEGSNIGNAILYVPEALVETYKATAPWNGFKEIRPLTTTGISEISSVKGQNEIYNMYGQKVENFQKGFNIFKGKKILVK